jgi:hypothetical protein
MAKKSKFSKKKKKKLLTPVLILMRANGIPVGDLKAGINLSVQGQPLGIDTK